MWNFDIFFFCQREQSVEETVMFSVIWDESYQFVSIEVILTKQGIAK